jgi:hypothetical protein
MVGRIKKLKREQRGPSDSFAVGARNSSGPVKDRQKTHDMEPRNQMLYFKGMVTFPKTASIDIPRILIVY